MFVHYRDVFGSERLVTSRCCSRSYLLLPLRFGDASEIHGLEKVS